MKIELLGALDYEKVKDILKDYTDDNNAYEILNKIEQVEISRRTEIVSTAGRLSRFPGDVLEVLHKSEEKSLEQNKNFANRVISMGHRSITDHDYLVFALKDVSAVVEQMIIAERMSSFTIKSRREVDFSKAGYYIPNFHDENGNILEKNEDLKIMYKNHMNNLFSKYSELVDKEIPREDARFILPYCYYSNIMMGVDAHTLLDMIIKFTKTKYAKVDEFKEFGDKLYEIAKKYIPYIIPTIDSIPVNYNDKVDNFLKEKIEKKPYKILDHVKLINNPTDVDDQILIASIMRRYQWDKEYASKVLEKLSDNNKDFKLELMRNIAFKGDRLELSQVNFDLQIPVSYAILTHFTRHRTHKIMVPDFFPNIDLMQYKTPPKIKNTCNDFYDDIYKSNKNMYDEFKKYGIRDEDLIYFTLSGNMTNIITNMDGWTVRHILELRECNKAQWETREISYQIHNEIKKLNGAENFSKILGSTCVTQGICNEGKECCGKIYKLKK